MVKQAKHDLYLLFFIFEDGTVWKVQQNGKGHRYVKRGGMWHYVPDQCFNRPQELEDLPILWNGTLYGTNETVWWGHNQQRRIFHDGFIYHSKTKQKLPFVSLIHAQSCPEDSVNMGGVYFDKELNYRVRCVNHFQERRVHGHKTSRRWWLSPCNMIGGYICRKVGSNSSKDFYLIGTKEAEDRLEAMDFPASQKCVNMMKRKEEKQKLRKTRRKKQKLVTKERRWARDQKYLQT